MVSEQSSADADGEALDVERLPGAGAQVQRRFPVLPPVALGVVGVSIFLAMPVVAAALAGGGFRDEQVGHFSAVQLFGISAGSAANLWLAPRLQVRTLARLGVCTLAAMDLACVFSQGYTAFITFRVVAGLAGGVLISTATAALARTRSADRSFGWFVLWQILFQMASAWALPRLDGLWGLRSIFGVFVGLDVAAFAFIVPRLPAATLASGSGGSRRNTPRQWLLCLVVLGSILGFFTAVGAFWTFVARIGESWVGLSGATAGSALAVAGFGGLIGAILPAALGSRFGRAIPTVVAIAALGAGLELVPRAHGVTEFALGAALFSFGWFLLYPYQLAVLATLDRDGRPMIASAALTGLGLAIGPTLVVHLLPVHGLAAAGTVALASVAICGALILGALGASGAAADAHALPDSKSERRGSE